MRDDIARVVAFEATRARFSGLIGLGLVAIAVFFIGVTALVYRYALPLGAGLVRLSHAWPASARPDSALAWIARLSDRSLLDLLAARPALMCLVTIMGVSMLPSLVTLLASDQIGSDLGRGHIRFLLPRLSRRGLFFGRALAAWLTWLVFVAVACPIMGIVLGLVDPTTGVAASLGYGVWTAAILALYALPFVALMSLANTLIPRPFLAYLAATTALFLVSFVAGSAALVDPAYGLLRFVSPTSVKYWLLTPDAVLLHTGGAVAALLAYTAVFLALGDRILQRRDV